MYVLSFQRKSNFLFDLFLLYKRRFYYSTIKIFVLFYFPLVLFNDSKIIFCRTYIKSKKMDLVISWTGSFNYRPFSLKSRELRIFNRCFPKTQFFALGHNNSKGAMCDSLESEVFFINRKGGTVLLCGGYQYYKLKSYKNVSSIWRCSSFKKLLGLLGL